MKLLLLVSSTERSSLPQTLRASAVNITGEYCISGLRPLSSFPHEVHILATLIGRLLPLSSHLGLVTLSTEHPWLKQLCHVNSFSSTYYGIIIPLFYEQTRRHDDCVESALRPGIEPCGRTCPAQPSCNCREITGKSLFNLHPRGAQLFRINPPVPSR